MLTVQPPRILILARQPGAARRWAESLADATSDVWLSAADLPPGQPIDVIVTDRQPAAQAEPFSADVGVVAIGGAPGADATLAPDFTTRELCLACRLVAEIARLRSQRDELDRVREEVTQLAHSDPLTGLPNRRAWDDQFASRLARGAHARVRLWLAFVDLDGFKRINDSLGMTVGDEVLARAAAALAGGLRREDMVARLGGDEFGILLWDVPDEHVARVFDRLRTAVARAAAADGMPPVTASIGYVSGVDDSADPAARFLAAERAMRAAKRAGGNRALRGAAAPPTV